MLASLAVMTDNKRVVTESTVVAAPAETVFAILADPRQHPRIDGSGTVKGGIKGPDKLSKGATFGVDMKMYGVPYKIRNTVVEYDEGRRIAWRHFGGHRWRYVLEPQADGSTKVTESFDYSMYSGLKAKAIELAGFPAKNRQGIVATLERLKQVAAEDAAR